MDDLKTVVAKRLNKLMENSDLSQTEFADRVGISKDIISKLVHKKYSLSIPNAIRISKAFGVSLDFLYGLCTEENANQYALKILLKHFCVYKETSHWNNAQVEVHVSVSSTLATLLDGLTSLKEAKIPDDIRTVGEQRLEEDFLKVIETRPETQRKYVLLDADLYVDKVKNAVAEAKEELNRPL